jgi:RNase adapter protein RapZ
MELVIITGLSGAGKSRGVDALEDIGFFCADNMPPKLIPTFAQLILSSKETRDRVAIVTDIRVGGSFKDLFIALDDLKTMNCPYKILFFDANNEVLLRRYKETRRKHPLIDEFNGSLIEALDAERIILQPARQIADYIIDTSNLTATECKERVSGIFLDNPTKSMSIHCISFGYKYGIPTDSDLVFDVRCLPNPFYENSLKERTGLEKQVYDFVMKWDQAKILIQKLFDLIDYLVPLYRAEGKSQLVISVGCTGGRHRSVVFAELIREHLSGKGLLLSINHRDIKK